MDVAEQSYHEHQEGRDIHGKEDVQIIEEASTKPAKVAQHKRNYFWCPLIDCTSGPVQKITQHLQKKHKLDPSTAAKVAKKKRLGGSEVKGTQSTHTFKWGPKPGPFHLLHEKGACLVLCHSIQSSHSIEEHPRVFSSTSVHIRFS